MKKEQPIEKQKEILKEKYNTSDCTEQDVNKKS